VRGKQLIIITLQWQPTSHLKIALLSKGSCITKTLTGRKKFKDFWSERFYLFCPIGMTNPIRVYYFSHHIGSVDPSNEVHYCLYEAGTLTQGAIFVETIVNSIPAFNQVGNPRREAIKQDLYKLIQEKRWQRIRGFNFWARDRSFKLAAIVDQRP
jgi:hypothetical protein